MTSEFPVKPSLQCDIVMKGGITSGVVYPGAVVPLARRYRFRSIGGASAGAIAAAIVAAAEHARQRDGSVAGFEAVAGLPEQLAGPENGKPLMTTLFRSERSTRPLYRALIGALAPSKPQKVLRVIGAFRRPLAGMAGVAIGAGRLWRPWAGVAIAPWAYAAGLGLEAWRSARVLSRNDFGVCRLGPGRGPEALTPWLHQRIQETACSDVTKVLTFADLWGVPRLPDDPSQEQSEARVERLQELSHDPDSRVVDLQMMTTDLTHGRPMRLPVPYNRHRPRLEEGGGLLFEPRELRKYFPEPVVAHLEAAGGPVSEERRTLLRDLAPGRQFRRFPIGPDLPVVVATRMSLSFPFLISAVPLYDLERHPDDEVRLRRVLFSDGGITSNFPVHFFDSPLPTRPTFGLHLTGFAPGQKPAPDDPARSVSGPVAANQEALEEPKDIDSLGKFGVAIKDAMQNWRDNAQAALPGFRERVVHIRLAAGEGGLNLTMPRDKTLELSARGGAGGEALVRAFADAAHPLSPTDHWNASRFARYRTTMAQLERFLRAYVRGYAKPADDVTIRYDQRVAAGRTIRPYRFESATAADLALDLTAEHAELVAGWGEDPQLDDRAVPRPPSTLRSVPPV